MDRRKFLSNGSKAGLGTLVLAGGISSLESCGSSKKAAASTFYPGSPGFTQAALGYDYNALEPAIDAKTMEIHFTKHAATYTKNMTDAMAAENVTAGNLESLLANISKYSAKLRNNAGGHYNHESFWKWMTPKGKAMSTEFTGSLESAFESVAGFKSKFADAGMKRFGSGWAWLYVGADKKLAIGSTPNQDNPLMDNSEIKGFPILGIDVWEHAYYLKYQNKRADYINAWWDVVNWQEVETRYKYAVQA